MGGSAEGRGGSSLVVQDVGPVRSLRLNDPQRRNALTTDLVRALREAAEAAESDRRVRAVRLCAAGPTFCSGTFLPRGGDESERPELGAIAALFATLAARAKPLVAEISGAAVGTGLGLACLADVTIAARSATVSLPELRLGLQPKVALVPVVARLGAASATRVALAVRPIPADEACRLGLVDVVAGDDRLAQVVQERLDDLATLDPAAVRAMRHLVTSIAESRRSQVYERLVD